MIKLLKVESKHDNVRVARAIKKDVNEEYDYQLEFIPNNRSLSPALKYQNIKTILRHQINSQSLISYDLKLERGLYDVFVTRVESINGTEIKLVEDTRIKYPEPVMVGGRYKIKVKISPADCYNTHGILVQIISEEIELDEKMIYYRILKEELKDIKYYIPFQKSKQIAFFVENINMNDFSLNIGNPSFEIEYV